MKRYRASGKGGRGSSARGQGSERRARERRGRLAEWVAAALLIAKGYRVVARRYRCAAGEIDLVAIRGRRLAFVEVKQRARLEDAEGAISAGQAQRMARSAAVWLSERPRYQNHEISFDAVYVVGGGWGVGQPVHVRDACRSEL